MRRRRKYHGLFGGMAKRRCPHSTLRAIYGDEIFATRRWWRLRCLDCGRFIDGEATMAANRRRQGCDV